MSTDIDRRIAFLTAAWSKQMRLSAQVTGREGPGFQWIHLSRKSSRAEALAVDGFIQKPFEVVKLASTVRTLLDEVAVS